jgi:YesN/AraC family two-component response regulator
MPEKDGFETILEMKRICPDIKIIAMSGVGCGHSEYYLDTAKGLGV